MRIIVSDTSCLIDLSVAKLLAPFAQLPHTIIVPAPLWQDELLSVTRKQKSRMIQAGVDVRHLSGAEMETAQTYFNRYGPLRLNDCFALTIAESFENAILLTGDKRLKRVSRQHSVTSHGVLWATDEMHRHECCSSATLRRGLQRMRADPLVFVPVHLIDQRLRKYR